jgi:hypothetical protein
MGGIEPEVSALEQARGVAFDRRQIRTAPTGLLRSLAASANEIINGSFRQNQRGYVSGASIPIGTYCFDRWKASGVTNLALNPIAATATTFWGGVGATVSRLTGLSIPGLPGVSTAVRGTMAAVAGGLYDQSDSTSPYALVGEGKTYRVSAWLRSSVAKTIQPAVQLANSAGTNIGAVNAAATVNLAANTWTFVTWTVTMPTSAVRLGPYWYSTAAWAAGNTLDVTGVMITQGAVTYPYFDGSMTDCSWAGTANASASYNVPNVVPTLTYTSDVHGQTVMLNAGARLSQIVERANAPAGAYTISHDGSAQVRAYLNLTPPDSRPAFANGPVSVTVDGTDHVVVEFSGGAAGATISNVRMYSGAADFGYAPPSIVRETLECQRYYVRFTNTQNNGRLAFGTQVTTVRGQATLPLATQLRRDPDVSMSNISWTDSIAFTAAISGLTFANGTSAGYVGGARSTNSITLDVTYASNGAASRPGFIQVGATGTGYLDLDAEIY